MSRTTLSALAAGACIALAATPALSASARVDPIRADHVAIVRIALGHNDACGFQFRSQVARVDPLGYPVIIARSPIQAFDGCTPPNATLWEDGSASSWLRDPIDTSSLAPGKYFYMTLLRTHRPYQVWGIHTAIRSFWVR